MYAVKDGETKPITRMKPNEPRQAGVLWCPFCGRSHQMPAFDCRDGCGAVVRQEEPAPAVVALTIVPTASATIVELELVPTPVTFSLAPTASETIAVPEPAPAPLGIGARLAAARAAKRQERKEQAEREAKA